jgi:hypothetical protein
MSIPSIENFYENEFGHKKEDLNFLYGKIYEDRAREFIFLAGDNTFDNKILNNLETVEINDVDKKLRGYEKVFSKCKPDVAYQMNKLLISNTIQREPIACINCASKNNKIGLKYINNKKIVNTQEEFIQEKISENDILIVSIGLNDIVEPLETEENLMKGDYNQNGYPYFNDLFSNKLEKYIRTLYDNIERQPKSIIICLPYLLYNKDNTNDKIKNINLRIKNIYKFAPRIIIKNKNDENIIKYYNLDSLFSSTTNINNSIYYNKDSLTDLSYIGGQYIAEFIINSIIVSTAEQELEGIVNKIKLKDPADQKKEYAELLKNLIGEISKKSYNINNNIIIDKLLFIKLLDVVSGLFTNI